MRRRPSLLVQRALLLAVLAALAAAVASEASGRSHRRPGPGPAAEPTNAASVKHCRERMPASLRDRGAKLVAPTTTIHLSRPVRVTPPLGHNRYVFPLPGPYPPFADTFGAPRADTGWHHGDDLFAPRGTSVLAAADGIVFSVGWNRIGGWRLWLEDSTGNLFYYAHLQRYSPLAVDGRRVQAGQTLGYVGVSGDAVHTPPHLFFEINPAGLRDLGYDGAIDPTTYLRRWTELREPVPATEHIARLALPQRSCRGRLVYAGRGGDLWRRQVHQDSSRRVSVKR